MFLDKVLIVSSKSEINAMFEHLFKSEKYALTEFAASGYEARRRCIERDYDIVIINSTLPDEYGDSLVLDVLQKTGAGVIFVVDAAHERIADINTTAYGAFVLPRPFNRQLFFKTLRFVEASRCRMNGIRRENIKLQKEIEEIRTINRAKCILMEYLSMTEPQAHKYLEKQAMDLRITKLEVANNLLSTYDS